MSTAARTAKLKVSVVVVTYYTGLPLWSCLESVLGQKGLHELIVVDNGNLPEIEEKLDAMALSHKRLRIIHEEENVGYAKACNHGAAEASGNRLMLLNPDCILPENALVDFEAIWQMRTDAGLIGGRITSIDGSEQRGSRRNLLKARTAFGEATGFGRIMKGWALDLTHTKEPEDVITVPAISGACFYLSMEQFHELGGMDERFFLHVEDLDFCKRVGDAGRKVYYAPHISILHYRSTSQIGSAFVEKHKTRGFIRYFFKHQAPWDWFGIVEIQTGMSTLRYIVKRLMLPLKRLKAALKGVPQELAELRRREWLKAYCEPRRRKTTPRGQILVTGATSQVGIAVIGQAVRQGHPVIGWHRQAEHQPYEHPALIWHLADMRDAQAPLPELSECRTLIHCAPLWYLPGQILRLSKAGITRIIAFSSSSIEGKAATRDRQERKTIQRLTEAEEKLRAQAEGYGIDLTILRPTLIYGLGLDRNIMQLISLIREWDCLPFGGKAKGRRQPVHADDLAQAALRVLEEEITFGKTYTLAGGEVLEYRQMTERLFSVLDKPAKYRSIPMLALALDIAHALRLTSATGEMIRRLDRDLVFDNGPAHRDFHYNPRRFLTGGLSDIGEVIVV